MILVIIKSDELLRKKGMATRWENLSFDIKGYTKTQTKGTFF